MSRFVPFALAAVVAGGGLAAPVPQSPVALVAGLNDPSAKVRDGAAEALKGRTDALPWLRRAARSADADTARRASTLLTPQERNRQAVVARAIDACIRDGRADLFMEWHHYWQPEAKDDLWPVGPRMIQAGLGQFVKWAPPEVAKIFEREPARIARFKPRSYDGPLAQMPKESTSSSSWSIRTDLWWNGRRFDNLAFASVAESAWLNFGGGGYFFVLGSVHLRHSETIGFIVCDGEYDGGRSYESDSQAWGGVHRSFVACRGPYRGGSVGASMILVDGDVELFGDDGRCEVRGSLIRATGEIRLPKNAKVVNSTIQPHTKNATAPYTFFDLPDVGLSAADDEEGLVVADVKPGTPFGNCGLKKGDVIQAIDDRPAGHSAEFRRQVRRAMVRQGDCLLTVARGAETLDLALYFPLPK
ncbi:MAG: hypothetical protein C0501_06365 [Isosphaera sp.]|nr:hypothetical protein [Isosphaera sp.]